MVGARSLPIYEAQAKARMRAGAVASRQKGKANLPAPARGQARDKASATVNVAARTVQHAATVLRTATAEVIRAVDAGKLAVSTAADLAVASSTR